MLRKHPPHSIATIKGQLDQTHQNQRSTKIIAAPIPWEWELPSHPLTTMNALPTCTLWALILLLTCVSLQSSPPQLAKSDQTGKFILPSSTGNNYVIIIYDYDSNFNFAQPFCNCTAACLLAAFKHLHIRLCQAGLRQKLQRLDNGCSTLLKELLLDVESIDFQLVPPAVHHRNAAKHAIKTFHNHFIAGLCGVDKDFPLHLWDQLISQAELTLNLLRASRINPKLSAWAQVHGIFDDNRCPLAPPGCCVLVHENHKIAPPGPHML